MDFVKGLIVRSGAGHDKEQFFVIIQRENDYAFISDGKRRKLEKPKKKKLKHLFPTNTKLQEESFSTDKKIRIALREFKERGKEGINLS